MKITGVAMGNISWTHAGITDNHFLPQQTDELTILTESFKKEINFSVVTGETFSDVMNTGLYQRRGTSCRQTSFLCEHIYWSLVKFTTYLKNVESHVASKLFDWHNLKSVRAMFYTGLGYGQHGHYRCKTYVILIITRFKNDRLSLYIMHYFVIRSDDGFGILAVMDYWSLVSRWTLAVRVLAVMDIGRLGLCVSLRLQLAIAV